MSKQFKMVCGLWITPDFTEVLSGRAEPPRVNHDTVNFEKLRSALATLFPYGPRVHIQVPNDTIDQVAVHVRQSGRQGITIRCEDFGSTLLMAAKRDDLIDIREIWSPLHALPDRSFAPPPVILPFVVTAVDFEDAMIWQANTRPSLGLKPFDPIAAIQETTESKDHDSGSLPLVFREALKEIFGTPYEKRCVLDRMAWQKPPREYGLGTV